MKIIQKAIVAIGAFVLATAHSAFAVSGVQLSIQGTDVVLRWPSRSCQTFIVGYRPAFDPATPWTFLTTDLAAAAGDETTFTHTGAFQGGAGQQMAAAFGGDSAQKQVTVLSAEERQARIEASRESAKKAIAYLTAQLEAAVARANATREERMARLRAGLQPVATTQTDGSGSGGAGAQMSVGSMGFYLVAEYGEDSDGDGLRNYIELEVGLNLLQADTDGDSITDGDEDMDGDGVGNFNEVLRGTFINEADSEYPPPLIPFGTVFYREENFTLSCTPSGAMSPAGAGGTGSQDLVCLDASPDMAHAISAVETSPGVLSVKLHSIYIGPEFGAFSPQGANSAQNPFPRPSAEQIHQLDVANGVSGFGHWEEIDQGVYDTLNENTLDWAVWEAENGIRNAERTIQLAESGQRVATEAERQAYRATLLRNFKRIRAGTSSLARQFGRAVGRHLPLIGGIMILPQASAIAEQWNTAFQDYATDIRNGDDTTGSVAIIAALSNDLAPGSGNFVLNALLR